MPSQRTRGYIDLADCADRQLVIAQVSEHPYRLPQPCYPGQDMTLLLRRIPHRLDERGIPMVPDVNLHLFTIRDGWFAVGNGLDGLILTHDRKLVRQSVMFTDPGRSHSVETELSLAKAEQEFDSVFLGFDGAWTNWYHWLCFALPRSALAAEFLPDRCVIALPDYATRKASTDIRYSEATWRQSLAAFLPAERATALPPGLYRSKQIQLFWTATGQPTDLTLLRAFHDLFAQARRTLNPAAGLPKRVLISREGGGDWRLSAEDTRTLNHAAESLGFVRISLEQMDFTSQMQLMANAEAIAGVHGAGLTNLLFAQPQTPILEINMPLQQPPFLRPWFYLLAHARSQPYRFLDASAGDVTEARITAALKAQLASRNPR